MLSSHDRKVAFLNPGNPVAAPGGEPHPGLPHHETGLVRSWAEALAHLRTAARDLARG